LGVVTDEDVDTGFDGESALLGHELAYCLGQLKDPKALPILTKVLEDDKEHPMVRHEVSRARISAPTQIGSCS
jgi:deoxyhypusine monooxygenase